MLAPEIWDLFVDESCLETKIFSASYFFPIRYFLLILVKSSRLSWSVHIHEITSSLLEKWSLFIRKGILCLRNNSYASIPLMTIPFHVQMLQASWYITVILHCCSFNDFLCKAIKLCLNSLLERRWLHSFSPPFCVRVNKGCFPSIPLSAQ